MESNVLPIQYKERILRILFDWMHALGGTPSMAFVDFIDFLSF